MARVNGFPCWACALLMAVVCCGLGAANGQGQNTESAKAASQADTAPDIDLLIQQLNDPDWQVRMHAADELMKHPDAKAVPALIDALGDEQYNVWTSAANALKAIGAPAVDALMAEMDDPDPRYRRMAAQVLGGIPGALAQRGLHKALDDPDTIVRVNAISGIAGARNLDREDLQNRVSLLINVIIEDPNELVWSNAADALAKIKDHAAQQTLIYALSPGSQGARWRVAQALGKTQNADAVMPLLRALVDVDTQVRRAAASALGELGSFGGGSDRFAVTGLLNGLRDPDAKVRANVALALGKMHDDGAVEPLIGALSDPDSETRASAAQALGMLRDDRAVEPLIAAMKDPNIYVRINAANAVTAFRDPRAIEPLIGLLGWGGPAGQEWTARDLATLGDPRAVEPLIAALKNSTAWGQAAVAEALGKFRDPRAVETLIGLLGAQTSAVRQAAAAALGEIGDARAVDALIQAFPKDAPQDESPKFLTGGPAIEAARRHFGVSTLPEPPKPKENLQPLRAAVAEALGKIGDPRAIPLLAEAFNDPSSQIRMEAAKALGNIRDARATETLIAALGSRDVVARRAAVAGLSQRKDPRTIDPLIRALKDPDPPVRDGAASALGDFRDPRAIRPLIETLRTGHDQSTVMPNLPVTRALVAMGPAAVEPLIRALKDPDQETHAVAALALGTLRDPRAFQPLLAAERDPNQDPGSWAKIALAGTLLSQDVQELNTALQSGDAVAAVNTLSWMGKRGVPLLIEALNSRNPETRKRAAWVLSKSADRRAAPALLAALRDQNDAAIAGAYIFFVQRGDAGTEDALIAAYRKFGDPSMQDTFQTCGNAKLRKAANTWQPTRPDLGRGSLGAIWGQRELNRVKPLMVLYPAYWAGY